MHVAIPNTLKCLVVFFPFCVYTIITVVTRNVSNNLAKTVNRRKECVNCLGQFKLYDNVIFPYFTA